MEKESNYEPHHLTGNEALEKVRYILKHFRNTMMISSAGGTIHSRPMGLQGKAEEFEGTLWFFTDRDCRKVDEIEKNPAISLLFQSDDKSAFTFLMLEGSLSSTPTRFFV